MQKQTTSIPSRQRDRTQRLRVRQEEFLATSWYREQLHELRDDTSCKSDCTSILRPVRNTSPLPYPLQRYISQSGMRRVTALRATRTASRVRHGRWSCDALGQTVIVSNLTFSSSRLTMTTGICLAVSDPIVGSRTAHLTSYRFTSNGHVCRRFLRFVRRSSSATRLALAGSSHGIHASVRLCRDVSGS